MITAMCRFQKYIVCGVFYILYWWYGSKRGQNCPILENGKITDSLNISKMMLFRNTLIDRHIITTYQYTDEHHFNNESSYLKPLLFSDN